MSTVTYYQLLKSRKENNDYFKTIANEVGLDYEHLNINFIHQKNFKLKNDSNKNVEYKKIISLNKETDALCLFTCESDTFRTKLNLKYGGFELVISLNANNLYSSFENGHLNERVLALETNHEARKLLKEHNIEERVDVSLLIRRFGNYKNSNKKVIHEEVLHDSKNLYEVLSYGLTKLKSLESKVKRNPDVVTSAALMGLNLPQDYLPAFMTISGMDVDSLKGSKTSIMWYTSDEDGKGFDMNIEKANSYLISPYIKDYLSFNYYHNFNTDSSKYTNINEKNDLESLMSDLLELIENDKEFMNEEGVLYFKELLEKDEICNDYMLSCIFDVGDFDVHTQPSVSFYEVVMNNNFVMDSDEIDVFKDEEIIELTEMYELFINSIHVLNEAIKNSDYTLLN